MWLFITHCVQTEHSRYIFDLHKVATFRNLDADIMQKIQSIILFDNVHTASARRILEEFTTIPVAHMIIERQKFGVDMKNTLLEDAIRATWVDVSLAERNQFYDRYISYASNDPHRSRRCCD